MRAVVCKEFGPPEKLVIETLDDPTPGRGEVVVEMRAAAITFPETLIIENRYQFKDTPPFVLGGEVAGRVCAVGPGVADLEIGDDVLAGAGPTGGFAERLLVPAAQVRPLPKGLDYAEATGMGYAYGTAHYGLKYRADLKAGETLLVLGAAGSVGLAAIEIGKILGARVIAAASTAEKLELCQERGADETIDYTREDLKTRAKALSGDGVDVVYDAVGGERAEAALRATAWRGRYLVIGFTAGIPTIPLNLTLLKGCSIVGVFWGASRVREPEVFQTTQREIEELAAADKLHPYVAKRYPLEEVPQALRDMIDRKVLGKIVAVP